MERHPRPWTWRPPKSNALEDDCGAILDANENEVCWFGDDSQYYPTAGSPPNQDTIQFILDAVNSR